MMRPILLALLLLLASAPPAVAGLTLGANTSDRLDCGSAASLDDLDPFTWGGWFRVTTITSNRQLISKRDATLFKAFKLTGTIGNVNFEVARATTNTSYTANTTPFGTAVWKFIAVTYDSTATPTTRIYIGDERTAAAETATYSVTTDGSGAITSDAAVVLVIGNSASTAAAIQGDVGPAFVANTVLSTGNLDTIRAQSKVFASTKLAVRPGYNALGSHTDWSGNGNTCTPSGGVRTAGPQIPLKDTLW